MSVRTWFDEFCPEIEDPKNMSDEDAVQHALKKYTGLLSENLQKHKVTFNPISTKILLIEEGEEVYWENHGRSIIGVLTCSLCLKYDVHCEKCPLQLTKIEYGCLHGLYGVGEKSPYSKTLRTKNPLPMIEALTETLEFVRGRGHDEKEKGGN